MNAIDSVVKVFQIIQSKAKRLKIVILGERAHLWLAKILKIIKFENFDLKTFNRISFRKTV